MIEFRSAVASSSANATMVAALPPSNPGDLLIALLSSEVGLTEYTMPGGWTAIDLAYTPNRSHTGLTAFYKISTGSEPETATFVQRESKRQVCVVAAFSGISTSAPIDAALFTKSDSASVSTFNAPSVSTTTPSSYVLRIWATSNTSFGVVTPPPATEFIGTVASNAALYVVGELKTSPGATGVSTASWTSAPRVGAATIAIAPQAPSTKFKKYTGGGWIDVAAQVIG